MVLPFIKLDKKEMRGKYGNGDSKRKSACKVEIPVKGLKTIQL